VWPRYPCQSLELKRQELKWRGRWTQVVTIPQIELHWSNWIPWHRLTLDARRDLSAATPPNESGVYEARHVDQDFRLTIGKASNLRMRVKQGLVKGKAPHSTGEKLRSSEDTESVVIRWAVTDRPSAVEEELHKQHVARFGRLPEHTNRT
jgi:hypothetical protein